MTTAVQSIVRAQRADRIVNICSVGGKLGGLFRFTTSSLVIYSVLDHTFHSVSCKRRIDGIEISEDQHWLYLAPMTNSRLFRVPMEVVLSPSLSPETFNQSVEAVGQKPMSDGIAIDQEGRVVITDVEHGGIMALNPTTRQLSLLGRSKDIAWPDGIVVANGGDVYFTDSAIPSYIDQLRPPIYSKLQKHRPYFIYRLRKSKDTRTGA